MLRLKGSNGSSGLRCGPLAQAAKPSKSKAMDMNLNGAAFMG